MKFIDFRNKKIFIAGKNGLLGNSIKKIFKIKEPYSKLLTPSSKDLDLTNLTKTEKWFKKHKPDYVIIAAAKAAGILDNIQRPTIYMIDNIKIQTNLIYLSHKYKVKKLIFIGSSCIYPKYAKNPIKEESLLSGALEETNQWYAITKIHGVKLCQAYKKQFNSNFISVMPTNLYGINDKYDEQTSHVIPALIKKFLIAKNKKSKSVEIWGSGSPKREFLFSEDCAEAIHKIMKRNKYYDLINVGSDEEIKIKDLALKIKKITNFRGDLKFNNKMPDGVMQKNLDINKIKKLGWKKKINLNE
jgi:GDP-L-fucose synthase